jgi:hypothetical protein
MKQEKLSVARGVALWFALLIVGLGLLGISDILWHEFIRSNFAYRGEAYYKGAGHILREDYLKGLILTVFYPMTFWFLIAFIVMTLVPKEKITTRIIIVLAGVYAALILLYGGMKTYELWAGTFQNQERLIAIVAAGLSRVVGITLGCWLAIKVNAFGRLGALFVAKKYDAQIHSLS